MKQQPRHWRVVGSLAVLLAALALTPAHSASARTDDGFGGVQPDIVGGTPAANGEFPFMVSLRYNGSPTGGPPPGHFCGGSLIHREWVLTAAHCAARFPISSISAIIGRTRLINPDGDTRAVVQKVEHPGFNPSTLQNDVALLRLSALSSKPTIQLAFPSNRHLWDVGDSAQVIGWGYTREGGGVISNDLLKLTVPIVSDAAMASAIVYGSGFNPAVMVGAGPMTGGQDWCQGDDGGPLFVQSIFGLRQMGVVSWGEGCARPNKPGVYARVGEGDLLRWLIEQIPSLANDGAISASGDFNGDGRDDLASFTRESGCDVYVASGSFSAPAVKWHDSFACGEAVPLIGDFNGDGRDDLVAFTRGSTADVSVALSNGTGFVSTAGLWHEMFADGASIPAVGDFDGDGRDDIAAFTRNPNADVFVALSNGSSFEAVEWPWHELLNYRNTIPAVGDFDGDGRDDIAVFEIDPSGIVYVALSDGAQFVGVSDAWHNWFSVRSEIPAVGDFNGDGRDDLATFTRGAAADVYVALSNGRSFEGTGRLWHDSFAAGNGIPGVADIDGDGRDDLVSYTRGDTCEVFAAISTGNAFAGNGWLRYSHFACGSEIPAGASTW